MECQWSARQNKGLLALPPTVPPVERSARKILDTSITSSATASTDLSTILRTSTSWSTICDTGALRNCTTGASCPCSATCRPNSTCIPCGSDNVAGRVPWVGGLVSSKGVALLKPHILAVMQGRRQLHCDGLTFAPEHRTQPPLPPQPSGARAAVSNGPPAKVRHTEGNTKENGHTCAQTPGGGGGGRRRGTGGREEREGGDCSAFSTVARCDRMNFLTFEFLYKYNFKNWWKTLCIYNSKMFS